MSTEPHTNGDTPPADATAGDDAVGDARPQPDSEDAAAVESSAGKTGPDDAAAGDSPQPSDPQASGSSADDLGTEAPPEAAVAAAGDPESGDPESGDPESGDDISGDAGDRVEQPDSQPPAIAGEPDDDPDMDVEPLELVEEEPAAESAEKHWYILKVQVNREGTIRDALERRVKLEGLEPYVEEIVVPTEDIAEFTKSGKRKITKRKLYPGYIMVNMVINDDTWFAVRETPGIGDFTGSAGKPTPMDPREVERILRRDVDEDEETQVKTSIPFKIGDHVRVKEGNFQNFEGDVDKIDEAHGLITVVINIFNRPTPVEIQYWQIEKV